MHGRHALLCRAGGVSAPPGRFTSCAATVALLGPTIQPTGGRLGPSWDQTYGAGALALEIYASKAAEKTPISSDFTKWRGPESNRRHHDFQSCALPTELPRRGGKEYRRGARERPGGARRRRAERGGTYERLTAAMSSASFTLSATTALPLPSAALNFIAKSRRETWPHTSRPIRSLPWGSISVPPTSASSSTSRVTPFIVSSPATLNESSSIASNAVDSKR